MSRRGENIHKRKDGRWEGRYKVGAYESGATKYHSVYGKTYGEVKAKMRGIYEAPPAGDEMLFRTVLNLWMDNNRVRLKESTIYKYEYMIEKHIAPELGEKKVSQISVQTVNTFLEQKLKRGRVTRSGGLSPAYVKTMMLIIQSALWFAAEAGFCEPVRGKINKPSGTKKEPVVLDEITQKRLETYLKHHMNFISLGILLSLHTGLRIGEVCALSWDDIDLVSRVLHVRHTVVRVHGEGTASQLVLDTPKTEASKRDIPLSSYIYPILEQMGRNACSKFVVSGKESFLSPRTYDYRYHKVLADCGIHDVNYHVLRHTFATRCVEAGVDVKSLSEILGHANVSVTLNTYVHSSMTLKRAQLEKLETYSS